ncbi:MAG: hypothetical protein Phog2KO_49670 [Phototrophicaceae bacterium]
MWAQCVGCSVWTFALFSASCIPCACDSICFVGLPLKDVDLIPTPLGGEHIGRWLPLAVFPFNKQQRERDEGTHFHIFV